MFGYKLELLTDTEVIAYLFDLLVRRHKLPLEIATKALAPPFWKDIERMPAEQRKAYEAIRMVYGSALMNGPFSIIVGCNKGMIGLNDRIKLRPMIAGDKGRLLIHVLGGGRHQDHRAEPGRGLGAQGGHAGHRGTGGRRGMTTMVLPSTVPPEFSVNVNDRKCVRCKKCTTECGFGALTYSKEFDCILADDSKCVACQRCVTYVPEEGPSASSTTRSRSSLTIILRTIIRKNIYKQAETGGILLTAMGCDKPYPIYWDHMLIDACQVTNPSIDPLREPMELRTYLGKKPDRLEFDFGSGNIKLKTELAPNVRLDIPVIFGAMSYGAVSYNVHKSLMMAAIENGTLMNTGEGGLHRDFYKYKRQRHRPVRVRPVRRTRGVPERRRHRRDQDRPGSQAGHRRPPARRKDRRGSRQDQDDTRRHRRAIAGASP